jgi:hypothetical protein
LDFVHCDFTGVGFEWDGPHYALVWEVNPEFDAITVIPATSQKRKLYANVISVGSVLGLPPGDTTLLVSDMTKVSRKRLTQVIFTHWKKGPTVSRLKRSWINRIVEAIAVTFGNERTFEDYLKVFTKVAMPDDLTFLYTLRFTPVKIQFDETNGVLFYRIWNRDIYHSIKMLQPKSMIRISEKRQLIDELLSDHPVVRQQAEFRYQALYK